MSKLNVVVTGGASGIGESVVRNVVAAGGTAVIADLQQERGQALREELGDAVRFQRVDVTSVEDLYAATGLAEEQFGPLTGMVNNAGVVGAIGSILETTAEQYDRTMAILARGVFFGIQAAGQRMKPHGGGSIVSLASTAGMIGGLGPHVYTMAKHGVVGLTKSAASELSRSGIRVNAVAPGSTVTPMTAALADNDEQRISNDIAEVSPLGYAPVAQDMANAIMFCLGQESRYMSGHTLVIDAGQTTGADWQPPFYSTPAGLL